MTETTRRENGDVAAGKPAGGKAFARVKNESVEVKVERLIRWLNSPMDKMPYIAIQELYGMGKDGMPVLIEALSNSDCSIRANAALILGQEGDRSAIRYLKMALSDRSPAVCGVAEMAICSIVKRHFKEFDPKSVRTMAARLGGAYGRELDRMLGDHVPEPEQGRGGDGC